MHAPVICRAYHVARAVVLAQLLSRACPGCSPASRSGRTSKPSSRRDCSKNAPGPSRRSLPRAWRGCATRIIVIYIRPWASCATAASILGARRGSGASRRRWLSASKTILTLLDRLEIRQHQTRRRSVSTRIAQQKLRSVLAQLMHLQSRRLRRVRARRRRLGVLLHAAPG